ncbi:hypothetical protein HMPREF9370_2351 [Neisseria wadsworthii 9715]|uniref:Uncharacterized protein n=1 Tax=Neisseria wadsworthii 9715 TaxID=1030841 RepID=G4CTE1_9NEIS|nr:hypothetical protein HMPREF9370_2351 [Neisseria wadsworthii 9715]
MNGFPPEAALCLTSYGCSGCLFKPKVKLNYCIRLGGLGGKPEEMLCRVRF